MEGQRVGEKVEVEQGEEDRNVPMAVGRVGLGEAEKEARPVVGRGDRVGLREADRLGRLVVAAGVGLGLETPEVGKEEGLEEATLVVAHPLRDLDTLTVAVDTPEVGKLDREVLTVTVTLKLKEGEELREGLGVKDGDMEGLTDGEEEEDWPATHTSIIN